MKNNDIPNNTSINNNNEPLQTENEETNDTIKKQTDKSKNLKKGKKTTNKDNPSTVIKPKKDKSVKGFNIGANSGKAAGQSIMHCHIHLIPRREGDVKNPQGGVRSVIPLKQYYVRKP